MLLQTRIHLWDWLVQQISHELEVPLEQEAPQGTACLLAMTRMMKELVDSEVELVAWVTTKMELLQMDNRFLSRSR